MPPHLLINFEIKTYYQNESKFHGVCLRNNLIKNAINVINLDDFKSIGWQ